MKNVIKNISDSVLFIPGQNEGKYPSCNSIYIKDLRILVDPGSDRNKLKEIKNDYGVEYVWLSHWHLDHFTHIDLFKNVPICITEQDSMPMKSIFSVLDTYGIDEINSSEWIEYFENKFHYCPHEISCYLKDGEKKYTKNLTVEVVHTPGHTPGHISLFFKELKLLFLGDYDLTNFGPWYGDVNSSIDQTIASIKRLRDIPARVLIASHRGIIFKKNEKSIWDKYLNIIDMRDCKILNSLTKSKTINELISMWPVYGRKREPMFYYSFHEHAILKKHLDRLISLGKIKHLKNRYMRCQ